MRSMRPGDNVTESLGWAKISRFSHFYYTRGTGGGDVLERLIPAGHLHIHEGAIARANVSHVNLIS